MQRPFDWYRKALSFIRVTKGEIWQVISFFPTLHKNKSQSLLYSKQDYNFNA
jgi:hypothetical protein